MRYYSEDTVKTIIEDVTKSLMGLKHNDPKMVYPHIELPDNHGQLIDREALLEEIGKADCIFDTDVIENYSRCIDNAPTVLKAN